MCSKRFLYLWGQGGYYVLRCHADGSLAVPEGRRAWCDFARFAPRPLLEAALSLLKEEGCARWTGGWP